MIKRNLLQITALSAVMLAAALASCSPDSPGARTDCDIQRGPCFLTTGSGTEVTFDITPRPVKAMSEVLFTVTISKNGRPVSGATVTLDLTMPGMIMGKNSPQLLPGKDGQYAGKGVIVRCPSGRKIWKSQVAVTKDQGIETASFIFEVI